ncbi:hypothetical protein AB1Y20_005041 [Prymnesium parvum]|uniref:Uncharacterized protein n=1 Tax=Prymnesium parvum TaxID=97485 RepID=A0AB34J270_PRYPA
MHVATDADIVVECTTKWLTGRQLAGDAGLGEASCVCFVSDPYEGRNDVTSSQRRYFHYHLIAKELGAVGLRADLPSCVKGSWIAELYGESRTGFRGS